MHSALNSSNARKNEDSVVFKEVKEAFAACVRCRTLGDNFLLLNNNDCDDDGTVLVLIIFFMLINRKANACEICSEVYPKRVGRKMHSKIL
tara:strand:+ start:54 stop:326 length:273 start_codon:yes stop_codon:yes gene_type:complete